MADQQLATLSAITAQLTALAADLDAAASLDDLSAIEKKAEVLRHMASLAKLGLQWQNQFAAIRFRSMRKIGGVLHDMPKAAGGRPSAKPLPGDEGFTTATLSEMGFSYNYSSQCQKIFAAPDDVFEDYIRQGEVASDDQEVVVELTKSGLLGWIGRDAGIDSKNNQSSNFVVPSPAEVTINEFAATVRAEADRRLSDAAPKPPKPTPPKPPKPPKPPEPVLTGPDLELVEGITAILDGHAPKHNPVAQTVKWDILPLRVYAGLAVRKVDVFDTLATTAKAVAINSLCQKLDYSFNETRTDLDEPGDEDIDYPPEVQARRDEFERSSDFDLSEIGDDQPALHRWLTEVEPETEAETEAFTVFRALGTDLVAQLDNALYSTEGGTTIGRAILHLDSAVCKFADIANVYSQRMYGYDLDEMHDATNQAEAEIDFQNLQIKELKARIAELEGQPASEPPEPVEPATQQAQAPPQVGETRAFGFTFSGGYDHGVYMHDDPVLLAPDDPRAKSTGICVWSHEHHPDRWYRTHWSQTPRYARTPSE